MSDTRSIKSDVLALCARLGTVAQEGDLTKSRPAWVMRPMGDDEDDLWFVVWVDDKRVRGGDDGRADGRPDIGVSGIVSASPLRRVDPHVRSWLSMRNGRQRNLTIALRRVSTAMSEAPIQHLWVTGSVPFEGSLDEVRVALDAVIDEIEETARDGRLRIRQAEAKRVATRVDAGEAKASGTETSRRKALPAADLADIMAELQAMTGLVEVKALVRGLVDQHRFAALRSARGLRNAAMSPNLVFTGNPGTGKTTVARIVAQAYRAIGLLPKGHLVEVDRSDLVAKYVGQTALKTKAVCERALGGVLFVDEAYSLDRESHVDFGAEAVEMIMTFMESHRGELAVVVAGYPQEMASFMKMNPGLRSRFDTFVHFPDFETAELTTILVKMFRSHDYVIVGEARRRLEDLVASLPRGSGFGNARDMRNLFSDIVRRHAQRTMAAEGDIKSVNLTVIHPRSIPDPVHPVKEACAPVGGAYL